MPMPTNMTSAETSLPRWLRSHSSDWYMGTVEVFMPVPRPVRRRPTMSWARVKAAACRAAPMMTRIMPHQMERLRPRKSPIMKFTVERVSCQLEQLSREGE